MNIKISANLGFLWTDLSLEQAIGNASMMGFDAVECHWPYHVSKSELKAALVSSQMRMISINTSKGTNPADFGLNAIPGRISEARRAIENSVAYADAIDAKFVHLMAGVTAHNGARDTFLSNLQFASQLGRGTSVNFLIEPIRSTAKPGYFLSTLSQAIALVRDINENSVKIMFDTYHLYDPVVSLFDLYRKNANHIGHIQFSSIPSRIAPNFGSVDNIMLLRSIKNSGYQGYFGAEYLPSKGDTSEKFWLKSFREAWSKGIGID